MPEISEDELKSLNEAKTQLSDLTKSAETLKSEMENLKGAKEDLERKLDDADRELLGEDYLTFKEKAAKGTAGEEGKDGELDLERASNAEIVAHLEAKHKGNLDKALKDIGGKISETDKRMSLAFAQIDVTLTAMRHPDFEEHKDAIYKVAKENPSWGAEKCYGQWKMESEKTTSEAKKAEDKKAEEERKTLTEKGGGVPSSTTQEKELTKEEAADLAYRKAFGTSEKT